MGRKLMWFTLLVMISLTAAGCSTFTSPARNRALEPGKTYWFDYSASRRGAVFVQRDDQKVAICAEPSPDVALDIINKFKADVTVKGVPIGGEYEVNEKVVQLAKRTQTVMFLRESLYRLCELSLNSGLEGQDLATLYKYVIEAAAKMAEAELENARESKVEAETRFVETMQKTPGLIDVYKERLKTK